MADITIYFEAEINPTESEQKVKEAVENLFGPIEARVKPLHRGSLLQAKAKGREVLVKFHNILQRERIRAAARTALFEGLETKSFSFCLNKQVASAGHVSFSKETAESPLGPIKVKIETDNPRQLIQWLTAFSP